MLYEKKGGYVEESEMEILSEEIDKISGYSKLVHTKESSSYVKVIIDAPSLLFL